MKFAINKSTLAKVIEQRNAYLVLASGLLFLCILLSIVIFSILGKEKTIFVPPTIHRSFWITDNEVSPEYLSEMSSFFVYMRLNITPDNLAYQQDVLLHYIDPSYYGSFKAELVEEGDKIKADHISTIFYPINIEVDAKHLKADISGELRSNVGNEALPNREMKYEITYRYDQGRLLVSSFSEVKK